MTTTATNPGPRPFRASDIPGYLEALEAAREREFTTREDAWWNLTFDVGGVLLRTMTVQDYELLQKNRSPLLLRQMPMPEEMLMFLWQLSPEFEKWEHAEGWFAKWLRNRARKKHQAACAKMLDLETLSWLEKTHDLKNPGTQFIVPDDSSYAKVFANCVKYIDRMFFDKPAGLKKDGNGSGLHYLTSWFCLLQREFHLPTREIEKMTLPEMFARLREIHHWHNSTAPDFNAFRDALDKQVQDALTRGMSPADLLAGKLTFNLN